MSYSILNVAQLSELELHYREDGDPTGRPVVFANSLGTDLRLWDALLPLLPPHLRYIRFDMRGHGLSSCPEGPYSLQALTQDTEQLLDQLNVKDCFFVGLSIGGMIAQSLAVSRPDLIHALVLSNTAAKMGEKSLWNERIDAIKKNGLESISDAVLARWFAPSFLAKAEVTAWRNMMIRTPEAGYIACCHAIAEADLSASSATLDVPVMGIAGSEDGASPPALVQATIDNIRGAILHIIDNTGHLPCVENPQAYAALLLRFMKETAYDR